MPISPPTHRPSYLPTKAERDRAYDQQQRNRESKTFYNSKAWRDLRELQLTDHPYCVECLGLAMHTPATIVHHQQEVTEHPELALDQDNLVSLCRSCHSRLHAKDKKNI